MSTFALNFTYTYTFEGSNALFLVKSCYFLDLKPLQMPLKKCLKNVPDTNDDGDDDLMTP